MQILQTEFNTFLLQNYLKELNFDKCDFQVAVLSILLIIVNMYLLLFFSPGALIKIDC